MKQGKKLKAQALQNLIPMFNWIKHLFRNSYKEGYEDGYKKGFLIGKYGRLTESSITGSTYITLLREELSRFIKDEEKFIIGG